MSGRFEWSLEPNELSRLLEAKRRAGVEILDLTGSNPTRAGFRYPPEIASALSSGGNLVYEPSPWGLRSARQAVADFQGVDADRVMLTASTSESYSYLFKLLCGAGDNVLIPQPSYPLFEFLAKLECVAIRPYLLRHSRGTWRICFESLEQAIDGRTRAICVVNPNNPTGSFLKREEADRLCAIAVRHGLALISDEVFSIYPFGEDSSRVATLAGITEAPVFCLNGLSKTAGLPQMKVGWIVMSAPAALRERLELIADTFLSVSTPAQHALPALLELGEQVRSQIRKRTSDNLRWLETVTSPLPAEGGWCAVLPVGSGDEDQLVLELLGERDVLTQPGFFFDFETGGFLVLSLLTPPAAFQEGVRRILSAVAPNARGDAG